MWTQWKAHLLKECPSQLIVDYPAVWDSLDFSFLFFWYCYEKLATHQQRLRLQNATAFKKALPSCYQGFALWKVQLGSREGRVNFLNQKWLIETTLSCWGIEADMELTDVWLRRRWIQNISLAALKHEKCNELVAFSTSESVLNRRKTIWI